MVMLDDTAPDVGLIDMPAGPATMKLAVVVAPLPVEAVTGYAPETDCGTLKLQL